MQIYTGTYVGDGNDDRGITGVGFQPDFVVISNENATHCAARFPDHAGDLSISFTSGAAAAVNRIQSLDADGFTVGTDAIVNNNGTDYYFLAIRDEGTADIHSGTYTGDGNDNRNITDAAQGFDTELVALCSDNARPGIFSTSDIAADDTAYFGSGAHAANLIQSLLTNGFQVGSGNAANVNGETFNYITFDQVASYCAVGSFTGDGNDNRSISGIGFQPDNVWVKVDGIRPCLDRSEEMAGDLTMKILAAVSIADAVQALEADGFQVGTHVAANENGTQIEYVCFQEGTTAAGPTYTVTADGGSYALSGIAVDLLKNSKIQAAGGAYSLSGTAATLLKNSKLQADAGLYALIGSNVDLIYSGAAFIPKKSLLLLGVGK